MFFFSAQLSMKFKMSINIEIVKIDGIFRFKSFVSIHPRTEGGTVTVLQTPAGFRAHLKTNLIKSGEASEIGIFKRF